MYPPDPGGVFESDVHRRVMANLPNPDQDPLDVRGLMVERISKDSHLDASSPNAEGLLTEILFELEADGHAKKTKGGWRNTPSGFKALTGPPADPGDAGPAVLEIG